MKFMKFSLGSFVQPIEKNPFETLEIVLLKKGEFIMLFLVILSKYVSGFKGTPSWMKEQRK